jgi:WD40 repeat protein
MEDKVTYLIISPDSKYLVAFLDESLSVFSLENFEKLHTVKSESESFHSGSTPYRSLVHILKNNRLIYQGFGYKDNKKMYVVDLESGKNLYHVSHYKEYSSTVVSVHPSERVVAFGTGSTGTVNGDCDKRWYIHQADDGKQVSECTTEFSGKYGVTCLCLFGSDKIFAASALMYNERNDIKIFYAGTVDHPLTTVVPCQSLTGHSQEIVQLLFNKDENILYTASKDCTIRVWNVGRVVTEFNDKYLHSDKQFDETKTLED